jgi:pyruvate,water dikinase
MSTFLGRLAHRIRNWTTERKPVTPDRVSRLFKFKYTCFKDLLASNTELLNIITDLEEKLRGRQVFGMAYLRSQTARAVFHSLRMVKSLDDLSGHKYGPLFRAVDRIDLLIKEELGKKKETPVSEFIIPYSRISKDMVDWVGGKSANLGELRNIVKVPVPDGFAITTNAYDFFLQRNDLIDEINRIRMDLDPSDPNAIISVSEQIQRLIISAPVPADLRDAIVGAYKDMVENIRRERRLEKVPRVTVALRSSAIGEDSDLSYAGQYLSVLNVAPEKIVDTYKLVIASLYTPRAITYRLNKGMRDEDTAMSVACIEMVASVASGVMYSRHPLDLAHDRVLMNAVWGLGPYAVDGVITPDTYLVSKDPELTIAQVEISDKPVQLVANPEGGLSEVRVDQERRLQPCLQEDQIRTLARWAVKLERHYGYPQDIEWALAPGGILLMLQARPLHLEDFGRDRAVSFPTIDGYDLLLEGGAVAYPGVGSGPAFHVRSDDDLLELPEGAVLVAKHSTPQFVVVMKKAAAIVTEAGSVTGHMASLAREFAIPTILNAKGATSTIPQGSEITVDSYSGRVYRGRVPELTALERQRESAMRNTPVFEALRRVADWIVPLNLVDPRSPDFAPDKCRTLHDIMRFAHEYSYREMFQLSDILSDTRGSGARKLVGPIPLDLYVIDLGGGLSGVSDYSRRVTLDQVASLPFKALLEGMIYVGSRMQGPRPVDLGGFFSVMREQMLAPGAAAERFGDRSYAIVSDTYLNFSSRIGYHYSALDSYCGDSVNKNYITFSFKGGAADDVRRNRRARCIAAIFRALELSVEVREDRVDARFYKYEQSLTREKLQAIGRVLQFTRQMDMLMSSERSVESLAQCFLKGNYDLVECASTDKPGNAS